MSSPVALAGPYLAACALLVLAGSAKAARPRDTARAMAALAPAVPLPVLTVAVAALAGGEVALGMTAAVVPLAPLAAAVAASYAAFAAVVLVVRRRGGPLASCGCFGTPDTPATGVHALVNLVLAASAAAVAAVPPPARIGGELSGSPLAGVPLLALATVAAWLVVLCLGPLARLGELRRSPAGDG